MIETVLTRVEPDAMDEGARAAYDALQALTGVQLTRPAEWRRWWNSNKKRNKWGRHSVMPKERRGG